MKHVRSRRKAREAALRALYEIEVGRSTAQPVVQDTLNFAPLGEDLDAYVRQVVFGVRENLAEIDDRLARVLTDYDLDRVAAVDRNVLRIAAYELLFVPEMPPAVTLNEAIEIAKKYSTAESGRFVNGVLGKLLSETDKADWDPSAHPQSPREAAPEPEPLPETEEVEVDLNTEEGQKLAKIGGWKLRAE